MSDVRDEAERLYAGWAYAGIAGTLLAIFFFTVFLIIAYDQGEYHLCIALFFLVALSVVAFVASYRRAGKYEE